MKYIMVEERKLVDIILNYYLSKGFKAAIEIPACYNSVDIGVINNKNELLMIEAKISSMTRVIEQDKWHDMYADFILIATPKKNHRKNIVKKISELGFGLIHVDELDRITFPIEPARNILTTGIQERFKNKCINHINKFNGLNHEDYDRRWSKKKR